MKKFSTPFTDAAPAKQGAKWTSEDQGDSFHIVSLNGDWIATVHGGIESDEANAKLIAASPELLVELQVMTDAYAKAMEDAGVTNYPEALAIVRNARAAIAKATL